MWKYSHVASGLDTHYAVPLVGLFALGYAEPHNCVLASINQSINQTSSDDNISFSHDGIETLIRRHLEASNQQEAIFCAHKRMMHSNSTLPLGKSEPVISDILYKIGSAMSKMVALLECAI